MRSSGDPVAAAAGKRRAATRLCSAAAGILVIMAGTLLPGGAPAAGAPAGLRLIGTVESGPFTGAVMDDGRSGEQIFYRLNQKLPDGSRIVKVRRNHVVLKAPDGSLSELYTAAGSGGAAGAVPPPSDAAGNQQSATGQPEIAPAAGASPWQGRGAGTPPAGRVEPPPAGIGAPGESSPVEQAAPRPRPRPKKRGGRPSSGADGDDS